MIHETQSFLWTFMIVYFSICMLLLNKNLLIQRTLSPEGSGAKLYKIIPRNISAKKQKTKQKKHLNLSIFLWYLENSEWLKLKGNSKAEYPILLYKKLTSKCFIWGFLYIIIYMLSWRDYYTLKIWFYFIFPHSVLVFLFLDIRDSLKFSY